MISMKLSVYQMCLIAIIAALEYAAFHLFSNVLYLEIISFLICFVALNFDREVSAFSSLIFGFLLVLIGGFSFWNVMYLMIYPIYSLILNYFKHYLNNHPKVLALMCGLLSFLTGQLLQLPFILFSKKVTIYYLMAGLKTSIIQGVCSYMICLLLYKPLKVRLGMV